MFFVSSSASDLFPPNSQMGPVDRQEVRQGQATSLVSSDVSTTQKLPQNTAPEEILVPNQHVFTLSSSNGQYVMKSDEVTENIW